MVRIVHDHIYAHDYQFSSAIRKVSVSNLTMASSKIGLYLLVSIFAFHLLPSPVICDGNTGSCI